MRFIRVPKKALGSLPAKSNNSTKPLRCCPDPAAQGVSPGFRAALVQPSAAPVVCCVLFVCEQNMFDIGQAGGREQIGSPSNSLQISTLS